MTAMNWAIFCRVVDNFGDIGVCWRLARQLGREFGLDVTLWVDDLASFARIRPEIDATLETQYLEGVTVRHWQDDFPANELAADVVIEAFACHLPAAYLAQMQSRAKSPLWVNLEYLSAEDWVEGCHGLPSPVHDMQGLNKYFFFPGFTERTGGVFSEQQQREMQLRWNNADSRAFLAQLCPELTDGMTISLFAYEPPELQSWLAALAAGEQRVNLLVPEGRVLLAMNLSERTAWQCRGGVYRRGALNVYPLPMLTQDDYDRLLLSCDFNFVRGEDSFLRAQWAAKPFIWHIYPQDDDAHRDKLDAFLNRYLGESPDSSLAALGQMMQVWNHGGDVATTWRHLLHHQQQLQLHTQQWRQKLISLGDVATNLVRFVESKVK
ncbi:elongation factor P maturation arginine rhamnosyltransferase EarP [Chitinibacter sp. S2-10]|uniref:elongation factor P maturation arginine rhamnosyltransferase EarP n=1 Tax=Chitinibacter sp. S2-10 TaxID=3373597 RepID=UPI003977318B